MSAANAQTLEQQYRFFLDQHCRNLGFEKDDEYELLPGQAGPNLARFCAGPEVPIVAGGLGTGPAPVTTVNVPGGGTGASRETPRGEAQRARRASGGDELPADSPSSPAGEVYLQAGRTGGFLSLDRRNERQQVTDYEDGRRSQSLAATIGADYRFDRAVVGAALTYTDLSGDFTGGGQFEAEGQGAWLFASWIPTSRSFIDFSVSTEATEHRTQRLVGLRTVTQYVDKTSITINPALSQTESSHDSRGRGAKLSGGVDFTVGNATLGPRAALTGHRTRLDAFTESGSTPMTLTFDEQTIRSQRASVGFQASKALSLERGAIVMQLNVDWLRELENDQRRMMARFAEDLRADAPQLTFLSQPPDRNWHTLRLSVVGVFSNRLSGFFSLDSSFGHAYLDSYGASLGIRREFQ